MTNNDNNRDYYQDHLDEEHNENVHEELEYDQDDYYDDHDDYDDMPENNVVITNLEHIKAIAEYIKMFYDSSIEVDNINKITEGYFNYGFCPTCSYWENGIEIEYKRRNSDGEVIAVEDSFYNISLSACLNWIALGKPPEELKVISQENKKIIAELITKELDDLNKEIEDHNNYIKEFHKNLKPSQYVTHEDLMREDSCFYIISNFGFTNNNHVVYHKEKDSHILLADTKHTQILEDIVVDEFKKQA